MMIESAPGQGTVIRLHVPVSVNENNSKEMKE